MQTLSVLNNFVRGGRKLSALAKALGSVTSKRAVAAGMDPVEELAKAKDPQQVSKKLGKKYRFGRRLIGYERRGPFQRQVEVKYLHGEAWPVMQEFYVHRLKHATKGWRAYTGGPALRMPYSMPVPPYPVRFFGRNHRCASTYF
jgi:hypothetical protein